MKEASIVMHWTKLPPRQQTPMSEHQFKSQLLCSQVNSLLNVPGKSAEDAASTWAAATHMQNVGILASCFSLDQA